MTGPPPVSIVGEGRSSTSPSPACKGDIEYKGPHIQQKGLVIYYYIDIQRNSSNIPNLFLKSYLKHRILLNIKYFGEYGV